MSHTTRAVPARYTLSDGRDYRELRTGTAEMYARSVARDAVVRERRRGNAMARELTRNTDMWDDMVTDMMPKGLKRWTVDMW